VQTRSGALVDTGRVGQIREVRPAVVQSLVQAGVIPVIAPLGIDEAGKSLNLNADTAAGALATALKAEKLLLMTDTPGVRGADGKLIQSLDDMESARLRKEGVIDGGMIPKVECALEAIAGGVRKCHIFDGREQHAILLEIFTDAGIGTEIVRRAASAK
jgi:acetylglutamate kinase